MHDKDGPHVLVLGVTGMLGSAVFRYFQNSLGYKTTGVLRSSIVDYLTRFGAADVNLVQIKDLLDIPNLSQTLKLIKPDIVINCIGVIKQLSHSDDVLSVLPINSLFPHALANICKEIDSRLIHISTDCVFSGDHGMYFEDSAPDARDLYGISKLLGEVQKGNVITLRTSIIGHELSSRHSLIDWFLSQEGEIEGYKKAIFSGLPTVELSRIIRDFVIPNPELKGLYHVSAEPISKFDLLQIVSRVYRKNIQIKPNDKYTINRSLNSVKFKTATGYQPGSWDDLVLEMRRFG